MTICQQTFRRHGYARFQAGEDALSSSRNIARRQRASRFIRPNCCASREELDNGRHGELGFKESFILALFIVAVCFVLKSAGFVG